MYSLISALRLRSWGRSSAVERATRISISSVLSLALSGLSSIVLGVALGALDFREPEVVADLDLGLFDLVDSEGVASAGLFSAVEALFSAAAILEID